jgi:DnaK suppressor protein
MPRAHKAAEGGSAKGPAEKQVPTKKAAAKSAAPAAKSRETSKTSAESTKAKAATKTAAKHAAGAAPTHDDDGEPQDKFLADQRELLLSEREEYTRKAEELKAEADALARETEPGDIQFDEEGGEGGTASIDREVDLVLSAQARAAVQEIDRALTKISQGTYGICESCNQPIPKARLKALPYAALCVQCKSGGLSRR